MAKKKFSNRPSLKPDLALRERIVAVAVEHPELGTRRLSRLLKTEGVFLSESGIRLVLLKQGLHTRKRRQQVIRTNLIGPESTPSSGPWSPSAPPEAGKFLPQIGREGEADEREPKAPSPVALPSAPEKTTRPEIENETAGVLPARTLEEGTAKVPTAPSKALPGRRPAWKAGKERWILRAVNTALICLAIYMATAVALKIWDFFHLELDSTITVPVPSASDIRAERGGKFQGKPLEIYRVIWERNLFKLSDPINKADVPEKIAVAQEDTGLKLMGTVLADDPKLSYAVIEVTATHSQDIFRRKERVGGAIIERILRNNVIIKIEDGQRKRLSVDDTGLGQRGLTRSSPLVAADAAEAQADAILVQLPREEIASALSNKQLVIVKNSITPRFIGGKPDGFYVVSTGPQDILPRMGIQPGDLIMGINGAHLLDPKEAEAIFQKFADGGDFSIQVQRGARIQNLHVAIN